MQVVPEGSDGREGRRGRQILVGKAGVAAAEGQQSVAADEDSRIAATKEGERKTDWNRYEAIINAGEAGNDGPGAANVLERERHCGGLVKIAAGDRAKSTGAAGQI